MDEGIATEKHKNSHLNLRMDGENKRFLFLFWAWVMYDYEARTVTRHDHRRSLGWWMLSTIYPGYDLL